MMNDAEWIFSELATRNSSQLFWCFAHSILRKSQGYYDLRDNLDSIHGHTWHM